MESNVNAPNILIVDDEIGPRESLRMILKPNYNVSCAEDGYAAIHMVKEMRFDTVVLDLKMAGISGIETLKELRAIDRDVMVIIITGYGTLQTAIEAIRHEVFDYVLKPFNVPEIMSIIDKSVRRRKLNLRIRAFLDNFSDHASVKESLSDSDCSSKNGMKRVTELKWEDLSQQDSENCLEFAKVLASTLEEKDPYTSGHSERVSYYSDLISKRLSLPERERGELQIASYLHDIGKIGISDLFINKKGALTSADWTIIKQHTRKSIELLAPLRLSSNILSNIHHHHEHFDGGGYPDGLASDQIPLGARIISVSDSYDSMTSERPYRKPLPSWEARKELLRCAGKQFDPNLISVFLGILNDMKELFAAQKHHLKSSSASQ